MKVIGKNNKLFFILCIIGCFLTPIFINVILSYDLIPSIGTDSSDWLGFWGSFLGSIIGGVATLIGVLYTINQMKNEKEDREKIRIIPLKNTYNVKLLKNVKGIEKLMIKSHVDDLMIYEKIKKQKELFEETKLAEYKLEEIELNNKIIPRFEILNISNNTAIEIKVEWNKPSIEEINQIFKEKVITSEEYNLIKNVDGENAELYTIPILYGCEKANSEKLFLFCEIQELIHLILKKYEDSDEDLFSEHFPLGEFIINFRDIYGKEDKCISKISMVLEVYHGDGICSFDLKYRLLKQ